MACNCNTPFVSPWACPDQTDPFGLAPENPLKVVVLDTRTSQVRALLPHETPPQFPNCGTPCGPNIGQLPTSKVMQDAYLELVTRLRALEEKYCNCICGETPVPTPCPEHPSVSSYLTWEFPPESQAEYGVPLWGNCEDQYENVSTSNTQLVTSTSTNSHVYVAGNFNNATGGCLVPYKGIIAGQIAHHWGIVYTEIQDSSDLWGDYNVPEQELLDKITASPNNFLNGMSYVETTPTGIIFWVGISGGGGNQGEYWRMEATAYDAANNVLGVLTATVQYLGW